MTVKHSTLSGKKVVIIGAGLAGLTTAYRLFQQGVDVEVYEARNRVGGRILTALMDGNIVEIGAQNISDGGEANHLRALIESFGIEIIDKEVPFNLKFFLNGKLTSKNDLLKKRGFTPEWLNEILPKIVAESNNMREILLHLFEPTDPLLNVFSVRLAGFEGANVEHLSPVFVSTLYRMLLGEACSIDNNEQQMSITTIKDGNSTLPLKLAEALNGIIHLQMPLKSVHKHNGKYELKFKNGSKREADILVLAIPTTVYEDISFGEQVIPADKLKGIKSVQFGSNSKIIIPFSESTQFINDRMVAFSHDNTLTFYYTGESSCFDHDTVGDIYEKDMKEIKDAFGPNASSLKAPQIAKDEHYVSYSTPVAYSWPNDPYAKGSYSTIGPGQESLLTSLQTIKGEQSKTLFTPVDGTLYFAGEHASILLEVPGTLEAACESAERTARMILKS